MCLRLPKIHATVYGRISRRIRYGAILAVFVTSLLSPMISASPSTVAAATTATIQDFDVPGMGTTCVSVQTNNPPGPTVMPGGPTGFGNFLRLASALPDPAPPSANTFTCPSTAPASDMIVADFDFRMTPGNTIQPGGIGRADGIGFALLNKAIYDAPGVVPQGPVFAAEEPNFAGSFGMGLDIYNNTNSPVGYPDDVCSENLGATFCSSLSIHFDGQLLQEVDLTNLGLVTRQVDLAGGGWIHARIILRLGNAEPDVTVILTPRNCAPILVVDKLAIAGLVPYEARAHFGARSGGETAHHDIDNIRVQFLKLTQSVVSLSSTSYTVGESNSSVTVTVMRTGNTQTTAQVGYATANVDATAGADYVATSGTLTFDPGQTKKQFKIPILRTPGLETDEIFKVILKNPKGAVIGGPDKAGVKIFDFETSKAGGRWNPPQCLPIVPVHTNLLPTGKVLFWDRLGNARLWNPATRQSSQPEMPPGGENLFCSGHAFLGNGQLLVAGGHDHHHGSSIADGVGLPDVNTYNAFTGKWTALPDMDLGRWYPTVTALGNGEMLVISGTYSSTPLPNPTILLNLVPQVWQPESGTWRYLTDAASQPENAQAHGVKLYPWMFVAPDGRVFKAGPDQDTWFLDTAGGGSWAPGPPRNYGLLSYGSAVMYAPGKILVVGGGNEDTPDPDATNVAEVIDLNDPTPAWRVVASMTYARRQHNATLLPNGKVLVTGGTGGEGFSNEANPILNAEIWDPVLETWTTLPVMQVTRGYHSTALLLPDGRVMVAGGGQGAGATSFHNNTEIYSPAYLFKGPRPKITTVPKTLTFGQKFVISTPNPSTISSVSLIRLPSVTHSFDQNQRFARLGFTRIASGLRVTVPVNGYIAPPGHYMLFIINNKGVPSVAAIVKLVAPPP